MKQVTPDDTPTLTQLDTSTLIALSKTPMHGYGIAQQINEDTGYGNVRAASVYKALNRLKEYGYIQESDTKPGTASPFQRRIFDLTIAGSSMLELTCSEQINQGNLGLHRLLPNRNAGR